MNAARPSCQNGLAVKVSRHHSRQRSTVRRLTPINSDSCRIRAAVGGHEALFDQWWGYVESWPTRIKTAADAPLMARAFVAIAIDDMRADLHLLNEVMRRLIVAAAQAGLDWHAALAAACKVANRSTGGGAAQMQEYFETFAGSSYFKKVVAPELRAAERRAREIDGLSQAS